MKAVVITNHGNADVLEVREIGPAPLATADRVQVRVRAAALNRADLLQRRGRYPAPQGYPQEIPGLEFAGEITAIGPDVHSWKIGQRVFGITGGGAQAEFVVVPANQLAEIPANLDWVQAGAVPEVFITAHDGLFTQGELKLGETLLVHAPGSGVGTAAIQLARATGARVIGTSRTAAKLERTRQYGLQLALHLQNDPKEAVDQIREWTGGKGVDLILDLVGAGYFEANLKSLALKGRMILVGTTSGVQANLDIGLVMNKRLRLIGTVLRARSLEEKATATRLFERHVVPLLSSGSVTPVVDSVFEMDRVRDAHLRLESNNTFGKVVLVLG